MFQTPTFPIKDRKLIAVWTIILIIKSIVLVTAMSFVGIGTENRKTESLQSQMTLLNFGIGFVSAVIISPIYEQIFYRGFLYRFFSSRYSVLSGMLISPFIFTVVHLPTFNTLPVNFVSGLFFHGSIKKQGPSFPVSSFTASLTGLQWFWLLIVFTFLDARKVITKSHQS